MTCFICIRVPSYSIPETGHSCIGLSLMIAGLILNMSERTEPPTVRLATSICQP
jgi:hypothetical protein